MTPAQLLDLLPDRDGMMSLTIAGTPRTADGAQLALGYLAPRAWANASGGSRQSEVTLFDRAGVDLIGSASTVVYRTRSAASARYIGGAFHSDEPGTSGRPQDAVAAAASTGVPGAREQAQQQTVAGYLMTKYPYAFARAMAPSGSV